MDLHPIVLHAVQTQNKPIVTSPQSLQSKYKTRQQMETDCQGVSGGVVEAGLELVQVDTSVGPARESRLDA